MEFKGIITKKTELPDGRLQLEVTFTDGVDTKIETIIPQDKNGFEYWVIQVAESLTTAKLLKTEDNLNVVVERTVAPDTRTAEQKAQALWLEAYYRLEKLELLAAKAFLTGPRLTILTKKIADTKTFLDANIKVEYLDVI